MGTYLVATAIFVYLGWVVYSLCRSKKQGKICGSGCVGCGFGGKPTDQGCDKTIQFYPSDQSSNLH